MNNDTLAKLAACPFCGDEPKTTERPDNIDGTEFFYAVMCYCGGYSATAHKMAIRKTPEQAKADAIEAWEARALTAQALPAAEPVAWQSRFESSKAWYECTKEHHDWVRRAPKEFPGYEARELFATPQPPQPDNLTSKSALKRIEVQAKPQGDA